jgi:hypothetical protein
MADRVRHLLAFLEVSGLGELGAWDEALVLGASVGRRPKEDETIATCREAAAAIPPSRSASGCTTSES